MTQNIYWGQEFNQNEAEIRKLKAELARIDADKQQLSLFAKSPALPLHTPTFSTYQSFYTPSSSRQLVDYAEFFGLSHLKHTPTLAHSKPQPKPTKAQSALAYHPTSTVLDPENSPELPREPQPTQKNKESMHQYSSQILPHLSETEETSTDEKSFTSLDSKKELADASKLFMAQPSTGSNDHSSFSPP